MGTELARELPGARVVARANRKHMVGWAVLALVLLGLGLWNLDGPPMWWDEGWTLSVARHWAEDGRYGWLRDGAPAQSGLEASFAVTLPVGVVMRVLGAGVWQGRVFGVLCATGATLLLAALPAVSIWAAPIASWTRPAPVR